MTRSPARMLTLAIGLALMLTVVFAGSVAAGGKHLSATLIPANEPGGGDPNPAAVGTFSGTFNKHGELCYELTASNLSATITAAHIHVAPAGVNGPVVIPLAAPIGGSSSGCIENIDPELIKAITNDPSAYYVNVHTIERPGGAIRGQLEKSKKD